MSIGGGVDADLIWELQPQLQFQINDNLGLRFGYRNLYYDLESDNGANKFDGSYRGLIVGLGGTFGNRPYSVSKASEPAPQTVAVVAPPPPMATREPPGDSDGDRIPDNIDKCPSTAADVVVDALGCGFNTTLAVQFDTNSATLKPGSDAELDRLVEVMKATPTIAGFIEGYTDSTGSAAYNKQLSKQRAEAVVDYLIAQGISSHRVIPRGFGEGSPVADNTTEEGRAQNRRVILRRVDADQARVSTDL
jgi:outer membrane protein OmpA-like peptidoglycan-associated protein